MSDLVGVEIPPWQARRGQAVRGIFRNARMRQEHVEGVVLDYVDGCLVIGKTPTDRNPKMIDASRFYEIDVFIESEEGRQARAEASRAARDLATYIKSSSFTPNGTLEKINQLREMFSLDRAQ